MPILKDFYCTDCDTTFEELVNNSVVNAPCIECGSASDRIFIKSAKVVGADCFNPHYDIQMGKYFKTKEQRQSFLKNKNYTSDGSDSPRKTSKTRVICSESQAKRFDTAINMKPGEF